MITSLKNEKVKNWRKLHNRKDRMKTETFIIEGFHLIQEAIKSNWKIKEIIIQNDIDLPSWINDEDILVTVVEEHVFQHISQTKAPQGIAAVLQIQANSMISGNRVLLLDRIQDPGNLGTIIRTADAAGFDAVVLGEGTVDLYNDKVIRSTQGSLFHIPVVQDNLSVCINHLKDKGYSIWASALTNSKNFHSVKPTEKVALILGNEGSGIDPGLIDLSDEIVKIPIYGKAESLNVSIAAGILMYYIMG
ncbi:TrmH family RNA methyltransferase [Ornithinibacillus halotolerans]|uniref:tRNA/rRNA methyltransferase YsgA n=1 Tax=Ornithinibacillus halotolerans TaxID=1274357 RepID=A0A916S6Y8_9BACI|nr:RNA methyltransferase [Ornithinibacillus halotolerans]GGA86341.1 putative tRNA/rRNA methyltransferase YsgA [Ornithinibacillus halotolerans]